MKKYVTLWLCLALLLTACANTNQQAITEPIIQPAEVNYQGQYLDYDNNEPNLQIAKRADGKYTVQIGIFRLTRISDGVGEVTEAGLRFTATDAAGNPIAGIITLEGEIATVTFTDSTWAYLENGASYQYKKSSDTPNIWSE